jgi:hypothetical protein
MRRKILLALFLVLPALVLPAFAGVATTSPQQPGDFTLWLQTQAVVGGVLPPVPRPAVTYCPCPSGMFCAYCNRNYVCVFNYPDPDYCPQGCVCGPL